MSLLSELEELQRCLEDTTDSESETVLQDKTSNDAGNELDTLLQSEYMSLAGMSDENSQAPSSEKAVKLWTESEHSNTTTQRDVAEDKAEGENPNQRAININPNSKHVTPSSASTSDTTKESDISTESLKPTTNTVSLDSSSVVNSKSTGISAQSSCTLHHKSMEENADSNSFTGNTESTEKITISDSVLAPKALEDTTVSVSSGVNLKPTENVANLDSAVDPKCIKDTASNISSLNSKSTEDTKKSNPSRVNEKKSSEGKTVSGSCIRSGPKSGDPESLVVPKEEKDSDIQTSKLNSKESSTAEDSFLKIEQVFSVTPQAHNSIHSCLTKEGDTSIGKRKSQSQTSSPVRRSPGVKKRKLYTEPPVESDLVEVPKGGASPEALLKLQNSNQFLKIGKPRSRLGGPARKRKLVEGTDTVAGPKRKKISTGNISKNVGNSLPVEVVVSPLGVKEPFMEQVAERLGKKLLEARVVLKRLNIPIPEHLKDIKTQQTSTKLQNTLAKVSKEIQETLTSSSQTEKKPKGRSRPLQKQSSGPQKLKEAKLLETKSPVRPKKSEILLKKASISARIGQKRKKIFTKKILTTKLKAKPVKNVALNKKNNITFAKQKSVLKPKGTIKPSLKKNTVSASKLKSKKVSVVQKQNAENVVPKKRVNLAPQKKVVRIKNNAISVGKNTIIKKVGNVSMSKKPLVERGTNISVGRKAIAKRPTEMATRTIGTRRSGVEKNVAVRPVVMTRNVLVSPKRPVVKKKPSKKPFLQPELNMVKISPSSLSFSQSSKKTLADMQHGKPAAASRSKDEDNTGEDEWLVEYLIDEDMDLSAMKDAGKVSSSDDRWPSSRETVPECDSSTDKKMRNSRKSAEVVHKTDITMERKMAEMRKAIGDLERIADRSMLRLKAEERQVVYLSNKLHYFENDKHFKMLQRVLKDAAPGPRQNADAVFIVDLLLSYCPDDENEDINESGSTMQTSGK